MDERVREAIRFFKDGYPIETSDDVEVWDELNRRHIKTLISLAEEQGKIKEANDNLDIIYRKGFEDGKAVAVDEAKAKAVRVPDIQQIRAELLARHQWFDDFLSAKISAGKLRENIAQAILNLLKGGEGEMSGIIKICWHWLHKSFGCRGCNGHCINCIDYTEIDFELPE